MIISFIIAIIGFIFIIFGIALTGYGYAMNDSVKTQLEYLFRSGSRNPGSALIILGIVCIIIGVILLIFAIVIGILDYYKKKQNINPNPINNDLDRTTQTQALNIKSNETMKIIISVIGVLVWIPIFSITFSFSISLLQIILVFLFSVFN